MTEVKNGVLWKDCMFCGKQLPQNILSPVWHASAGMIDLCPNCVDTWTKENAKGFSMQMAQGWWFGTASTTHPNEPIVSWR